MTFRSTTKTRTIEIRITEEEHNLEQAAATVSGETLSESCDEPHATRPSAPATPSTMEQRSDSDRTGAALPRLRTRAAPPHQEAKPPAGSVTAQLSTTAQFDYKDTPRPVPHND
jgi:hypothetical protein